MKGLWACFSGDHQADDDARCRPQSHPQFSSHATPCRSSSKPAGARQHELVHLPGFGACQTTDTASFSTSPTVLQPQLDQSVTGFSVAPCCAAEIDSCSPGTPSIGCDTTPLPEEPEARSTVWMAVLLQHFPAAADGTPLVSSGDFVSKLQGLVAPCVVMRVPTLPQDLGPHGSGVCDGRDSGASSNRSSGGGGGCGSGVGRSGRTSGAEQASATADGEAQLVVANAAALALFNATSVHEFEQVLRQQLFSDMQVTAMLYGSCRKRKTSYTCFVPNRYGEPLEMEVISCLVAPDKKSGGGLLSCGLLASYRVPCSSGPADDACSTASSSTASYCPASFTVDSTFVMDHIRWPVTVFDRQGRVVYQNHASCDYMGDVVAARRRSHCAGRATSSEAKRLSTGAKHFSVEASSGGSCSSRGGVGGDRDGGFGGEVDSGGGSSGASRGAERLSEMQQLFRLDATAVESLLVSLQLGQDWKGTVHFPPPGRVFAGDDRVHLRLQSKCKAVGPSWRSRMGQAGTSSEGKSQQHRLSLQPSISSASTGSLSPPEPATATERQGLAPASSCSAAVAAAAVAAAAADGFGGGGNIGDGSDGQRLISFQTVQGWSNASEASRPDGRVVTTQPSLRQLDSRIAIGPAATTLMRHASCVTQWPSAPRVHNATTRTASQLRSMDLVNSSAGALRTVSNPQSPQLPRPEGGQKVWHEVTAKLVHDPLLGRELILLTHADHTAHMEAAKRTADLLKSEHAVLEKLFPRHVIEHMVAANAPSVIGGGSSNHGGSSRGAASGSVPITPAFFDEIGRPLVSLARGSASDAGYHGGSGQGSECGVAAANGSNSGQSVSMPMRLLTEAAAPSSAASNPESLSTYHKQVTIMFADIVEFTSMCKVLPPSTIMAFLNKLYSAFDELVSIFNVYKVETVGDCYIVAGGLMHKDQDGYTSVLTDVHELHALAVLQFAKAMLSEAGKILNPATGEPVQMRVGMHSGPIVSGVIGTKMPRFCLFGDSMNTAQRMESASRPGGIHVSEATQRLLPKECWLPTDGVELKGLGKCPTYFWAPRESRKRPQRVARTASMIDLSFLKVDEGDGGSPDLCVVINEEQEAAGGMSSRGSTGGTWGGSTGADTSGRLAAPTWSASKMLLASATGSSRGLLPPPLPPPSRCSRKAFGNSKSSTLASMGSATLDGLLAGLAASSLLDDEESSAAAAAAEAEVGNDDDDGEDDAINTSTCALFAGCVLTD